MIVTFDALAGIEAEEATPEQRTIRGIAVPWDQVGTVSDGTRVRFLPGSLDAAGRPSVRLGHDGPAIGRVASASSSDAGLSTEVRVSRTRDGDEALVLASDGVLGMFSIGADPTEFSHDEDGTLVVAAADWHHLALLDRGAFSGAVVTTVAAQEGATMTITEPAPPAVAATEPVVTAAPAVVPVTAAAPAAPPLTLARIAHLVAGANRGEISTEAVKATLAAALTNVTSTNVGAIVPPIYRAELTAIVDHGTPLLNVLGDQTLPASGMSIEFPEWTTKPTTGLQATEKSQIVSTAVAMNLKTAPIVTLAGGNDLSLQSVERSSPSFLEAYLRAAAVDWGRKAEAYVLSILTPLAEVVAPGAGTFLDRVQLLMASLDPNATPAGPLFVAMSYDVAMPLISVKQTDAPGWWDGSISFGSMTPNVNADGLNIVVDWNLPAKTMLAGSTQAATVHKSAGAPTDIRVYGYLSVTVEYPGAISVMTLP
jgi:hypothetical protein